jgi:hypothetical protein
VELGLPKWDGPGATENTAPFTANRKRSEGIRSEATRGRGGVDEGENVEDGGEVKFKGHLVKDNVSSVVRVVFVVFCVCLCVLCVFCVFVFVCFVVWLWSGCGVWLGVSVVMEWLWSECGYGVSVVVE